jgi:glycosyltransferase involved in cell wall biosynthesis
MGTHNGAAHIAEQLESILSQSLLPSEIVLSDDASSDDTVHIAREVIGSRVPLTVLLNKRALGVTANFEQAISACTGEFVALSDQDDVWLPDRLATAVSVLARRPDLLLLHADARLVDAKGEPIGHTLFDALELTRREREFVHGGRAIEALLRRNLVTGATTVFRRELAALAAPFPTGWVHDEWLAIIAAATGQVDLVDRALIDYRQHGANQIGASRLSLGGKIRRVMEPRGERNRRLATNFATLESRLEALGTGVDSATLVLARGKAAHERMRLGLPPARPRRVVPVLRAVVRGDYRRFSRGNGDVLRDLVQPAN